MPADAAVATPTPAPVPAAVASSPAPAPAAAPASPAAAAPAATPAAPAPPAAPAAAADPKAATKPLEPIASLIGDKAPEGDKATPEAPKPEAAPVYELKLPEGVEVDAPIMDRAKEIFGKGKVTPEVAQELVGLYGEQLTAAAQAMKEHQVTVWNDTIKAEQGKVLADPELGGEKFPAVKGQIESGLQTMFGINERTPADAPARKAHEDFIAALKYTGAGSFLPVIRFLAMATKPHTEGGPVKANQAPAQTKTLAERMYPQAAKQAAE